MTERSPDAPRVVKVYAPDPQYAGISAGIQFANGVAELDPETHPGAMDYFRGAGYGIDAAPVAASRVDESPKPVDEGRESHGRRIAGWAPRAGRSPEERERFSHAVDRWLTATRERPEKAAAHAKGRHAIEQGWSRELGSFTSLRKARAPWDAADFEREAELATLDVDHGRGCPRPRPVVRDLGRRVDGKQAGVLECGHCGASVPLVDRRVDAAESAGSEPPPPKPRRVGRPGWSPSLFHERYRDAVTATNPPRTPARIAANFRRLDDSLGIEPDSLARLRRRHGRPKTDLG